MSQFSGGPLQRLYAQLQSTVGAVPNGTGTWTNTGANLVPHIKAQLRRLQALIEAEYKTGTGSMLAGIPGKTAGSFSIEVDLMPSGAAGTKPNCSPILASIFGADGVVVASTSVTYNLTDGSGVPLILALFNEAGGGNTNQFGYGGVTQNWSMTIGGNGSLRITADGQFFYVLESDNWANEDTTGKGGLTAFPAQPSGPALAGNIIPAYPQTITFGGTAVAEFRSMNLKGSTGRMLRTDGVGNYPDTNISQGRRSASLSSLKFQDSDGSGLATLKNAARSKAALDVVATLGNTAGYTITATAKQVQFGNATFSENGANIEVDFDDSPAHASALANTNEVILALT